eukprot:1158371-Pelagomonas_calceolata.AAC.3
MEIETHATIHSAILDTLWSKPALRQCAAPHKSSHILLHKSNYIANAQLFTGPSITKRHAYTFGFCRASIKSTVQKKKVWMPRNAVSYNPRVTEDVS